MLTRFIKKNKIYLTYLGFFILFGFFISIGIFASQHYYHEDINEIIQDEAKKIVTQKKKQFNDLISSNVHLLKVISKDKHFNDYLENKTISGKKIVSNFFLTLLNSNIQFYQLRYLNKNAKEDIRVEQNKKTKKGFIVEESLLQDKWDRAYFIDTSKLKKDEVLISNLDLNIENKKIELPIVPVIRISIPVYKNSKFMGILILNLKMEDILNNIVSSIFYDIAIVDQDEEIVYESVANHIFTKYLDNDFKLKNLFNTSLKDVLNSHSEIYGEEFYTKNYNYEENLYILLKVNDNFKHDLKKEQLDYGVFTALIIILISIPLALIISIYPTRIRKKLDELLEQNQKSLQIIDKYIINTTTDENRIITHVSKAFEKLTGYEESELIGKKHQLCNSLKNNDEVINHMEKGFKKNNSWTTQTTQKKKNGQEYHLETTITPIYNDGQKIIGYKTFSIDITDKKELERIAQTDRLTQLYNRVKIDFFLEESLYEAQRYNSPFSLIILDIDKFKSINDNFGHQVGDSVLIELANITKNSIRQSDIVGRWGGEEFLIICPQTDKKGAVAVAEKLRKDIEKFDFKTVHKVTSSFGVSSYEKGNDIHAIIYKCDMALYKSKENGRNRVTVG